ncbi:hypothetical protein J0910_31210 [Nocardiopsis sp. CNT-189]|uniref:hypothetical protein n=1 Tax=Nocardiopsis oceanisediminis TaxID=2816862 RepID=UPI003B320904
MSTGYHEADDGISEALSANWRAAVASYQSLSQKISTALPKLKEVWRRRQETKEYREKARRLYKGAWEESREKLEAVHDPQWWREATPAQIAEVYGHALGWRDHEVQAEEAEELIHHRVREHYGVDLRENKTVDQMVEEARQSLEEAEQARGGPDREEAEHDREQDSGRKKADREHQHDPQAREELRQEQQETGEPQRSEQTREPREDIDFQIREPVDRVRQGLSDPREAPRGRQRLGARATRPKPRSLETSQGR